ncbi:caspase-13-like isoform X2 [Cynocephalus volans]|uniref:caspase-13-like isoform X2 n=1 Tax=Cynocephalus volans TaxID=110931 RepID=UPI002FC8B96B
MAEESQKQNPSKILESIGKEFLNGFLDNLVEKQVVKLDEEAQENFSNAKAEKKARILMGSVLQNRHKARDVLIQTLLNTNQTPTNIQAPLENESHPPKSEEYTDTLKHCPHQTFLKICKEKAGKIYPIKDKQNRTRLALIICNTEFEHLPLREGADLDLAGMKGLLEGLGYTVDIKERLTAKDMVSELETFATRPEHNSSDSTFLVFMSHGTLEGICGTKHSDKTPDVLPYDTIFQIFNSCNCVSLINKPKVIIVQACRGENVGNAYAWASPAISADSSTQSLRNLQKDAISLTHVEKDFVAFHSSTPHNVSYRDGTKGSFFIIQLIACFQKYSWCCHLMEIFREVQNAFETPDDYAQMPTIERQTMSRYFYLFPGH